MKSTTIPDVQKYIASAKWYQVGERSLFVSGGSVFMEKDTGVLRCAAHLVRLVYNVRLYHNECPLCATTAVSQLANI